MLHPPKSINQNYHNFEILSTPVRVITQILTEYGEMKVLLSELHYRTKLKALWFGNLGTRNRTASSEY
jgi:hypothetical protein